MKTTQVQLWLEVCPFDNSVHIKVKNEHEVRRKDKKFFNSIFEVIENKYTHTGYGLELKPNETRESKTKIRPRTTWFVAPSPFFFLSTPGFFGIRDKY